MSSAELFENGRDFGLATVKDRLSEPLLELDKEQFRAGFNRRPFTVGHRLADHPMFALPRLIELARRLPTEHVEYNAGNISVNMDPDLTPRTGLSVEETIERIEERCSWMVLKYVEQDSVYRDLLNSCLDEIQELSEPLAPRMCRREGFIFISSPGSVTPYHLDPEYNFLLQVRGKKTVNIFDPSDRSILPEQELERYLNGGHRNMVFKPEYQEKAMRFELTPGKGLHFPVNAPHWVQNGDEYSISFSITFRTPASERRTCVYSVNSYLRNRGITPEPFGRSPLKDSAKYLALRAVRRAKRAMGFRQD